MSITRIIKSVIAFLTIIPCDDDGEASFQLAADHMYFFPLIAALIGFLGGTILLLFLHFFPSPNLIAASLTLAFILIFTGFHHTDGLLDFGDAIMYKDSKEDKLRIMKEPSVGAGGLILCSLVILTTIFSIAELSVENALQILINPPKNFWRYAHRLLFNMQRDQCCNCKQAFRWRYRRCLWCR